MNETKQNVQADPAAEAAAPRQENKMGTMPVNKLLISMSLPMMASMLVQALYNVVDSIFVSRVCEDALTAVSMAFPIQTLMIAVGVGTGVGVNALLSKSLGEKNYGQANRAATNGLFLNVIGMLVFMVFGLVASHFYYTAQTDDPEIIAYGTSYLFIICVFSQAQFITLMLEKILVATGNTFYSMLGQMAGAITNIILDPIMIFGMFGLPAMGAAGAAIATVLGQCVGFGLDLWFNLRFNKEVELSFKGFRPHGTTIRRIYSVGVPCIGMQSIGSVMVLGMNSILMNFSSTAVAFFGVYFKLQSFVFMPVFGMNNGMVPILGYNYGARKPKRMLATIKLATAYATGIMLVGVVIVQLFAAQLLGIFDASDALLAIGVPGLRIICLSFIFAGISVVGSSVFQALGHGFLSLWVSVIRQLVVLLPVAWAIAHFTDRLELVWLAFPIAELVAVTLSSLFLTKVYRQVIKPMMNNS